MPLAVSYRNQKSGEAATIRLHLRFATTTAGAVSTLKRRNGYGTPARTGAGAYTVNLAQSWPPGSLLSGTCYPIGTAYDATKACRPGALISSDEANLVGSGANVKIQFAREDTGVAADVADGADIIVDLVFKEVNI